ncbi:MAG: hypothetical protein O2856_17695 [Planctomycetota bacterium]|nr:hypothetical protein [Planctomycetota bacterium]
MREKFGPWLPTAFCAVLAVIVTIGNLWVHRNGGSESAVTMVFILNMPICFFFVGAYFTKLRNDNRKLLLRIDALEDVATGV